MSEASAGAAAADPFIHKADPARRRLLLALVPGGGAVLYAVSRWFDAYLEHLPTDSTGQMRASSRAVLAAIELCLYGGGALLAALALYWFGVSRRMAAAARYPLPDMRLFHDMRILTGSAKQARARRLRRGAALAGIGAMAALGAALWAPQHEARQHPILFNRSLPDHRFDESYPLKSHPP